MSSMLEGPYSNLDLDDSTVMLNDSSFMRQKNSHAEGVTYFATSAKLNDSAMIEYGLKKHVDPRKSREAPQGRASVYYGKNY